MTKSVSTPADAAAPEAEAAGAASADASVEAAGESVERAPEDIVESPADAGSTEVATGTRQDEMAPDGEQSVEELDEAPVPVATSGEDEDATDEDDEDDEDDEEEDARFLPGDWYVIHTYAGYENKVRANLYSRIASMNMEDKIFDVVIPTEEVMEIKSGKKQLVQKKVFPGYILVRMQLDDDSWYVVRNTPGVTGFVGPGAKPQPLSISEVGRILTPAGAEERPTQPRLEFEEGEVVRVISGPFQNMSGPISEINIDQQTVKVLVDIFGRETPVTLTFGDVAKL